MATKSIAQLKAWFRKGMYPSESNFIDLFDSFFHKTDDIIPIGNVGTLVERLNRKLDTADAEQIYNQLNTISVKFGGLEDRIDNVYIDLDVNAIAALITQVNDKLETFVLMEQLALQSAQLLPLKMYLTYPARITYGNPAAQKIVAELLPAYQRLNLLFLGDDGAVSVSPDGDLTVNRVGRSKIHVIPTTNTALHKTAEIDVVPSEIVMAANNAMLFVGNNIFLT
ncbi:MAG: hypothetical protein RR410_08940 [Alistipes sp.]